MNCLDFRRQLLADPFCGDKGVTDHEDGCRECAAFARELRAQEVAMRSLLQDVAPPAGLAERIQLAAHGEQNSETGRRWWYSAAAAVFLAVGVSLVSVMNTSMERGNLTLAQSVLNHIKDESNHLREVQQVSDNRLKWVFKRFGAELQADIGRVNFAAECLMRDRNGVHLVLPGKMGPITVFFMPGEAAGTQIPVHSPRFDGEIVPTNWGSIAVVGEIGESLQGIGERMADAVRWPGNGLATAGLLGSAVVVGRIAAQQ